MRHALTRAVTMLFSTLALVSFVAGQTPTPTLPPGPDAGDTETSSPTPAPFSYMDAPCNEVIRGDNFDATNIAHSAGRDDRVDVVFKFAFSADFESFFLTTCHADTTYGKSTPCNEVIRGDNFDATNIAHSAGREDRVDVVFKFTFSADFESFFLTTCHEDTTYGTRMYLYNDSSLQHLVISDGGRFCNQNGAINNDAAGFYSNSPEYDGVALPNQEYFVVLESKRDDPDGSRPQFGEFALAVECYGPPEPIETDDCVYVPNEIHHDLLLAIDNILLLDPQPAGIAYIVPSAQACCEYCKDTDGCSSFSWSPYDVGYCVAFVTPLNLLEPTGEFYAPAVSGNLQPGARDQLVSPPEPAFPSDTLTWVLVGLASLTVLIFALSISLSLCRGAKAGRHAILLFVGLAIVDFISDCQFVSQLRMESGETAATSVVGLVFIVLPLSANLFLLAIVMVREFANPDMRDWFKSNATFATLVLVVSLAHIDGIALLSARSLFGTKSALFNAPLKASTRSQLEWFGIVGNFLEDIPQFVLQLLVVIRNVGFNPVVIFAMSTSVLALLVVIRNGGFNPVVLFAMSTSVLALLVGTSRHLLFCALHRYHKEDISRSRNNLESVHAVDIKSVRSLTNLEVPGAGGGTIKVDRVELSETVQTRKNVADASRSFGRTLTRGSSVPGDANMLATHSKKKTSAELSRSQSCSCGQTLSNPESS